jgi:hypothetical protein
MLRSLRILVRESFDEWVGKKEISSQPYQTHLPTLLKLAQTLRPRRIAEFGMGWHSTGVFLNRQLFPTVERLVSFEDDPAWFNAIKAKHGHDTRFDSRLVSPPMWKTALHLHAEDFDLVFVDDSRTEVERSKTLLALRLSSGITKGPAVVVHDAELPRLRAATLLFPAREYVTELTPQTVILCARHRPPKSDATSACR